MFALPAFGQIRDCRSPPICPHVRCCPRPGYFFLVKSHINLYIHPGRRHYGTPLEKPLQKSLLPCTCFQTHVKSLLCVADNTYCIHPRSRAMPNETNLRSSHQPEMRAYTFGNAADRAKIPIISDLLQRQN
jgi:hypothetical protein